MRTVDYVHDCDVLNKLAEILVYLHRYVELHKCEYPQAVLALYSVQHGVIPSLSVPCEHAPDGVCHVEGQVGAGGTIDLAGILDTALECIEMELEFYADTAPEQFHPRMGPEYYL